MWNYIKTYTTRVHTHAPPNCYRRANIWESVVEFHSTSHKDMPVSVKCEKDTVKRERYIATFLFAVSRCWHAHRTSRHLQKCFSFAYYFRIENFQRQTITYGSRLRRYWSRTGCDAVRFQAYDWAKYKPFSKKLNASVWLKRNYIKSTEMRRE